MSLVAVAVTLGVPNQAGEIPITTSNLAAEIAQAVTDTTTLAGQITTAQTDVSATNTDVLALQTAVNTVNGNVGTVVTDATSVDTSVATTTSNYTSFLSAYDTLAAAVVVISGDTYSAVTHQFTEGGSTGLTSAQLHTTETALNAAITTFLAANTPWIQFLSQYDALAAVIVGISGDTYSATTHQFTEGGSTGLTSAQLHTAMTSLNTAITSFLATQTFFTTLKALTATAKADALTAQTNSTTAVADAVTTAAASATAVTATNLLSTSAIAADHTAAQAIIAAANVFVQTDTTVATNVALLNGALVAALTFVRSTGILPT